VTESNRLVLGQIAAATATAARFICVTHTDNRLILLQLTLVSYYTYYIKNQQDATLALLFISNCKITLHVSDAESI